MASLGLVSTIGREENNQDVETQHAQQVSSRLRKRLSEPPMLDLTKRLIAIPSENPPRRTGAPGRAFGGGAGGGSQPNTALFLARLLNDGVNRPRL
ncbi:MAG TPA: hypothetical protein VHP35_15230, partial [Terriglobia bacterium]|nr:hypothetical protein [Terriglobia bacterium]